MDYAQWTWIAWQLLGMYGGIKQGQLMLTLSGMTIGNIILYWGGFFS